VQHVWEYREGPPVDGRPSGSLVLFCPVAGVAAGSPMTGAVRVCRFCGVPAPEVERVGDVFEVEVWGS
jgi:hypothetical protein